MEKEIEWEYEKGKREKRKKRLKLSVGPRKNTKKLALLECEISDKQQQQQSVQMPFSMNSLIRKSKASKRYLLVGGIPKKIIILDFIQIIITLLV